MDEYGKVYCAKEGGGAMREQYGKVVCGIGYCAADDMGRVKCSTRPGGAALMDSNGKVQCAGGCQDGLGAVLRAADTGLGHGSRTMKSYKPLLSSAPAHSILNARTFRYRNSADTDIRKTFARFRRNVSKKDLQPGDRDERPRLHEAFD